MSTAWTVGRVFPLWMAGLPTTTFPDQVVCRPGSDIETIGIARNRVLLDHIPARRADETDAKVICRLGVSVTRRRI
jgi:hypothetical protein